MNGRLINITRRSNGNLELWVRDIDKAALQEAVLAMRNCNYAPDTMLYELLEWYTCNGWTLTSADRIGALSEAPVLSGDITLEDNGEYSVHGPWWYYAHYQVFDPIDRLLDRGSVVFYRYEEDAA